MAKIFYSWQGGLAKNHHLGCEGVSEGQSIEMKMETHLFTIWSWFGGGEPSWWLGASQGYPCLAGGAMPGATRGGLTKW